MEFNLYKPYILEYLNLQGCRKVKGLYECPVCGSGKKRNRTGALKIYSDFHGHCFSCGFHGDLFNLICKTENVDMKTAIARAEELFGIDSNLASMKKVDWALVEEAVEPPKNEKWRYKDYIEQCIEDRGYTEYFYRRGFTDEDIERFHLGYDRLEKSIVIPYDRWYSYYLKRSTRGKHFKKPPAKEAGSEPIYNKAALQVEHTPCFVCESPIDAISIMAASPYNAVAIGGTGITKLLAYIDENGIKAPLVLSLDDDSDKDRNVGQESANDLMIEMTKRHIPCVSARYSKRKYPDGRYKDANEMLISNKPAFSKDLKNIAEQAMYLKENNLILFTALLTGGKYKGRKVSFFPMYETHSFSEEELRKLINGEKIKFTHLSKRGKHVLITGNLQKDDRSKVLWKFTVMKRFYYEV